MILFKNDLLRGKSPDYIKGFLAGVKLFAVWQNGIEYVGSCGTTYASVLKVVSKLLNDRSQTKLYEWKAVIDDLTCNECLGRSGRLFSDEQLDKCGRPPLHGGAFQHKGNCRCVLTLE